MKRLKIYIMHSTKYDYNNLLYKYIISSDLYLHHEIILPLSDTYKKRYVKDLLNEADLVVVDLYKPSIGERLELKWLSKLNKPTLYLSLDNKVSNKYKNYNIVLHDKDKSYINLIEEFINNNQDKFASKDNIFTLGDI